LFVIVLVTSMVTLNIGSGDRDILLQAAVEGLADSANYALDEAQFSGLNYGLQLRRQDQKGQWRYHLAWLEEGPTGWRVPESGKSIFAPVVLPEGVALQLETAGVPQDADALLPAAGTAQQQPQVILYASGETLPGAIDIRETEGGELLWRIEWTMLGDFQALPGGVAAGEEAL
jgi:hypothetical protein